MKAFPIQHGAIRIEVEDANDWRILTQMLMDAGDEKYDPIADITGKMADGEIAEDWQEFVVPDIRDQFDAALFKVSAMIEHECKAQGGGKGSILISREVCHEWYGVLNRARLALESDHKLATKKKGMPSQNKKIQAAHLRDRLYCGLQLLIIDHAFE